VIGRLPLAPGLKFPYRATLTRFRV
jgi:hypothetical protein